MPANWEDEERKFFESGCTYNPQFSYDSPATNKRFLKMFPEPKFEFLPQAKQIIEKFLSVYGSESNYFETEGRRWIHFTVSNKYCIFYYHACIPVFVFSCIINGFVV